MALGNASMHNNNPRLYPTGRTIWSRFISYQVSATATAVSPIDAPAAWPEVGRQITWIWLGLEATAKETIVQILEFCGGLNK